MDLIALEVINLTFHLIAVNKSNAFISAVAIEIVMSQWPVFTLLHVPLACVDCIDSPGDKKIHI